MFGLHGRCCTRSLDKLRILLIGRLEPQARQFQQPLINMFTSTSSPFASPTVGDLRAFCKAASRTVACRRQAHDGPEAWRATKTEACLATPSGGHRGNCWNLMAPDGLFEETISCYKANLDVCFTGLRLDEKQTIGCQTTSWHGFAEAKGSA